MFKKIKNKSVVQTVVDSITKAIIAGELKPGDKIPTELELAESFGVGRNSIREAIKILVQSDGTEGDDGSRSHEACHCQIQ